MNHQPMLTLMLIVLSPHLLARVRTGVLHKATRIVVLWKLLGGIVAAPAGLLAGSGSTGTYHPRLMVSPSSFGAISGFAQLEICWDAMDCCGGMLQTSLSGMLLALAQCFGLARLLSAWRQTTEPCQRAT